MKPSDRQRNSYKSNARTTYDSSPHPSFSLCMGWQGNARNALELARKLLNVLTILLDSVIIPGVRYDLHQSELRILQQELINIESECATLLPPHTP